MLFRVFSTEFINTNDQLANILTKSLREPIIQSMLQLEGSVEIIDIVLLYSLYKSCFGCT